MAAEQPDTLIVLFARLLDQDYKQVHSEIIKHIFESKERCVQTSEQFKMLMCIVAQSRLVMEDKMKLVGALANNMVETSVHKDGIQTGFSLLAPGLFYLLVGEDSAELLELIIKAVSESRCRFTDNYSELFFMCTKSRLSDENKARIAEALRLNMVSFPIEEAKDEFVHGHISELFDSLFTKDKHRLATYILGKIKSCKARCMNVDQFAKALRTMHMALVDTDDVVLLTEALNENLTKYPAKDPDPPSEADLVRARNIPQLFKLMPTEDLPGFAFGVAKQIKACKSRCVKNDSEYQTMVQAMRSSRLGGEDVMHLTSLLMDNMTKYPEEKPDLDYEAELVRARNIHQLFTVIPAVGLGDFTKGVVNQIHACTSRCVKDDRQYDAIIAAMQKSRLEGQMIIELTGALMANMMKFPE